jgi:hypothetical protein
MCDIILINGGEVEIETVKQFNEFFNTKARMPKGSLPKDQDCCLCQIDIPKELTRLGLPFAQTDDKCYYYVTKRISANI